MVTEAEYLVIGDRVPAVLDALFELPQSYVDALREFGIGEFVDSYRILPPALLTTYGERFSGFDLDLSDDLAAFSICAESNDGSFFGWWPSAPRDEAGEHPAIWMPRECFDLDDPDTRPVQVAARVGELPQLWMQPRWAGPGIRQPYFVTGQNWQVRSLIALSPGRSYRLAHDRLVALLHDEVDAQVLYQHADDGGASLRFYYAGLISRVYVGTVAPEHTRAAFDSRVRIVAPPAALKDAESRAVALLESHGWAVESAS